MFSAAFHCSKRHFRSSCNPPRKTATALAILLVTLGALLIYQRGGVLAWAGSFAGAILLIKTLVYPSKADLWLCGTTALLWALTWIGVFYYVISTWEKGEFVELSIDTSDGIHNARTWILDSPDSSFLYYDAPPTVATALLSKATVRVLRQGAALSLDQYTAQREQDVPEEEINQIFELMSEKYGDSNAATDVFYRFLGRSRDKIAVIIRIPR
tara:strand:- start:142 stop:780 length:639 start_codon:yes stop_codon:yes gene_type:complete